MKDVLRSKLNDHYTGPVAEEVRAGELPDWKDTADRSFAYKT
jgi:hypothetical protein